MKGNVNEIYTVQGTKFQTIQWDRALSRAQEIAKECGHRIIIYLNNNHCALVDRNGSYVGV